MFSTLTVCKLIGIQTFQMHPYPDMMIAVR